MGLLPNLSMKAELHRRETIKRFDDFLASYLAQLEAHSRKSRGARKVSVVARSPESPVVAALQRHADRLTLANCEVRAIFTNIEAAADLVAFYDVVGMCNGQNGAHEAIRWAKRTALLDAHEQLVLGTSHCWTGDAMRRAADVRFALDMFDASSGAAVALGAMAFDGLWSVSVQVPRSRFRALPAASGADPVLVQFDGLREGMLDMMPAAMTRH
jgi:hypothetical protein